MKFTHVKPEERVQAFKIKHPDYPQWFNALLKSRNLQIKETNEGNRVFVIDRKCNIISVLPEEDYVIRTGRETFETWYKASFEEIYKKI